MDANSAAPSAPPPATLDRTGAPTGASIEALVQKLVQDGAIMTLPGEPARRALIGDLRWTQGGVCWFAAFGDSPRDAHRVDFTDAQTEQRDAIQFLKDRTTAACLSTIDAAGVEDPDDYRVAWQLWQQVAPLRTKLIEDSYNRLMG